MAEVMPDLDSYIAGLPGVLAELKGETTMRAGMIEAAALAHVDTGEFIRGLKVKRHKKGYAVLASGKDSAQKNFGGYNHRAGRFVDGIHVMEAGLL